MEIFHIFAKQEWIKKKSNRSCRQLVPLALFKRGAVNTSQTPSEPVYLCVVVRR
jgi:hypothetical protein